MKYKNILLLFAAFACAAASFAQERDIRKELQDNSNRYGGSSAPYEFVIQDYHPTPEGYRPFYISHFGRHGSRMHTSGDLFRNLEKVLLRADSLEVLTQEGERAMDLF
ncbi:MAG: histidine-type phosphatase, partial [Candidatus Cryptobacteroides sp.]